MNLFENVEDLEEHIRGYVTGLLGNQLHVMPAQLSEDSADGHVVTAQPTVQRAVRNPDGSITHEDYPVHPDLPIHHMGGGGTSITHASKKDDAGALLFASRNIDGWFQLDGSQAPIEHRNPGRSGDGFFLSGIRSLPKKLLQVSQESSQIRTDDKKSVIDHGANGSHIKSVDPSTPAASDDFDPFKSAKKFFESLTHATDGIAHNATNDGTTHSVTNDHTTGPKLSAKNGAHTVNAHPEDGVAVKSDTAHTIDAPNASLDKQGNLSNQGDHAVAKSITAGQSVSAPTGNFAGGSMGGMSMASGVLSAIAGGAVGVAGGMSSDGDVKAHGAAQGSVLRSSEDFTVAALAEAYPPSPDIRGMRAHVTDASGPAFLAILTGGGATVCPAFCDGANWVVG